MRDIDMRSKLSKLMRNFWKKIGCGIILFCVCILISGCLDIEYNLKINTDGSGNAAVKVGMPVYISASAGDIARSLADNGYKVTTKIESNKYVVLGTRQFSKNQWVMPFPELLVKKGAEFKPEYVNFLFLKLFYMDARYELDINKVNSNISADQSSKYWEGVIIPFQYVISTPGTIFKHNADKISGNELIWQYTIRGGEKVNIEFISYNIDYFAILLLLTVIVIFEAYFVHKKKIKMTYLEIFLIPLLIIIASIVIILSMSIMLNIATFITGIIFLVIWKKNKATREISLKSRITLSSAVILLCSWALVSVFGFMYGSSSIYNAVRGVKTQNVYFDEQNENIEQENEKNINKIYRVEQEVEAEQLAQESYRIEGIVYSDINPFVMINGDAYYRNDSVCGGEIINITADTITISFQDREKRYRIGNIIK
jgi:hypothetical protein